MPTHFASLAYDRRIGYLDLSPIEYETFIASPFVDESIGADDISVVLVRGAAADLADPGSLPVVVCAVAEGFGGAGPAGADLIVGSEDVENLAEAIAHAPIAARSLVLLLRSLEGVSVDHGLAMESAVYSTLQAGPEFAAWRDGASHSPDDAMGPTVLLERHDDHLSIILNRPHRHNAISARLRDDLCNALATARVDDTITRVTLRGNGPSFCSGGDLGEFGQRSDPASAHVIRMTRSPARMVHQVSARATARIHGSTWGGGIETVSFAGTIIADPDTTIALPEIALGLIPGAGGTIGLTRRIGRQRTAALALTGRTIDADLALRWGLIDAIAPHA